MMYYDITAKKNLYLDDKFSYGDLVAAYKKQASNPNISVMSEFVHKELKALSLDHDQIKMKILN